jgi:antitoxin HicB
MLAYPVTLTTDSNGTLLVGFPDFPNLHSVGDDEDDALTQAIDALESVFGLHFDERRRIPLPSAAQPGQRLVAVPTLAAAKVLIWNEMFKQKLRKADLARLLQVHTPQIDRLFDIHHESRMDFVEQAAKVLGKSLSIELV